MPLLGAVDTAVVGHLGSPVMIGAVAIGSIIFAYLTGVCGFLRQGTTGQVAQAAGAGRHDAMLEIGLRAGLLGLAIGLGFIILTPFFWPLIAGVMGASDEISGLAETYFTIRLWGLPAALANFAVLGWFMGQKKSGVILVLQLALNGSNIILDLVLGLWMGLEVRGVAIASVIAEWGTLGLGIWLITRSLRGKPITISLAALKDRIALKAMFAINRDLFLRSLLLMTAFTWFTAEGARLGDDVLAANALLIHFVFIMAYGLDGITIAAEAIIGAAAGARQRALIILTIQRMIIWCGMIAGIFALAYLIAGPIFLNWMTSVPSVLAAADHYLWWAIAMPIIGVWCYVLDGIYIGLTASKAMRNGMAVSFIIFALGIWLLIPAWGNHGLWFSFALFTAMRAITLAIPLPHTLNRAVPA